MSGSPNFASSPAGTPAVMTLADATTTAPVHAVTIFTPPVAANGGFVERITYAPLGTVTATVIRIGLFDGANYRLVMEIAVTAYTNALGSVRPQGAVSRANNRTRFPILVPPNFTLVAWMNDAQAGGVAVAAEGGGF